VTEVFIRAAQGLRGHCCGVTSVGELSEALLLRCSLCTGKAVV
jgi:hypothetical protein